MCFDDVPEKVEVVKEFLNDRDRDHLVGMSSKLPFQGLDIRIENGCWWGVRPRIQE